MTAKHQPKPKNGFYCGLVDHRRYEPRYHGFQYRMAMPFVDVEELPNLCRKAWLWSFERANVVSFRTNDYLGNYQGSLKERVVAAVASKGGTWRGDRDQGDRVYMMAHPRYFGYVMNPIGLFFCYEGEQLKYVVAEVTNTPWHERHIYLLEVTESEQAKHAFRTEKEFHVSPFMTRDMDYAWRISTPGERFGLSIRNIKDGTLLFDANMRLAHRPWTAKELAKTLLQYPLMTAQVIGGIYWQALRLYLKKIRYVPHPGEVKQRTRLHHEIVRNSKRVG